MCTVFRRETLRLCKIKPLNPKASVANNMPTKYCLLCFSPKAKSKRQGMLPQNGGRRSAKESSRKGGREEVSNKRKTRAKGRTVEGGRRKVSGQK